MDQEYDSKNGEAIRPTGRTRRWFLAWLLLLGVPAGLDIGSSLKVKTKSSLTQPVSRSRPPFGDTSLMPRASGSDATYAWAGAQPVGRFTLWPRTDSKGPPGPWPNAKFELTLTLRRLDSPGDSPSTWTGPIDSMWGGGIEPFLRVVVALDPLVGRQIEAGSYRLYIDLREVEGAKAGNVSRHYSDIVVLPPTKPEDLPPAEPNEVPLRVLRFDRRKWFDCAVLQFVAPADRECQIFGIRLAAGTGKAPEGPAKEGDQVQTPSLFVVFEPADGGEPRPPQPIWGSYVEGGAMIPIVPGSTLELLADMTRATPAIGRFQVYGQEVRPASPIGYLLRDDVSTTGPVLLSPRPNDAPRPNWRFVPLEGVAP